MPAVSSALRNWRLRANPHDGTLRLTEDRALYRKPVERVFSLPTTGHADAIATVCLATFESFQNARTYVTQRMLLLDRDGRVVGAGRLRDQPRADEMWPAKLFTPLEQLGIRVISEWYSSPQTLERAHPRSIPKFLLWSWRRKAVFGLASALILLLIIGTAVYLGTH
jgi:hypothetical protein